MAINLKWTRVQREGVKVETYECQTPNGIVVIRQRPESVTWHALLGNAEIASGYTSVACKRAVEQRIEAMGRRRR